MIAQPRARNPIARRLGYYAYLTWSARLVVTRDPVFHVGSWPLGYGSRTACGLVTWDSDAGRETMTMLAVEHAVKFARSCERCLASLRTAGYEVDE